jgi:rubrerythrin
LEYLDQQPIVTYKSCEVAFIGQDLSEIIEAVVAQHHQIISLYKHLHSRSDIPSVAELTEQLIELEEHHVMQMVQGSNRMGDI